MKRKIPCYCDRSFTVDVPGKIDLDARAEYIDELMDGSFMRFTCPGCGKIHKPEFPLTVLWPSRNLRLEAIPETERDAFYRAKKGGGDRASAGAAETVIGYPELAERIAVYRDGLEPAAVEALKYYLLLKAEEACPGGDLGIWYQSRGPAGLEFHLHGIREGEVAVTRIPLGLYEQTREDYAKHPRGEVFAALRAGSYLSVQNTRGED